MRPSLKQLLPAGISEDDLTSWSSDKPRLPGKYLAKVFGHRSPIGYSYWNGNYWSPNFSCVDDAVDVGRSSYQNKLWCGLKFNPLSKSSKEK